MSEQVEIDVNQTTQEVTIEVTAGAGLGTVTSVAISGTDGIQVDSGSPIITSGTIVLGLSPTVLAQLSLASSALQPGDNISELVNDEGFLEGIQAGTNISIDSTDPLNPIISATGMGAGTVTSVAISGTDGIEVDSGSPITSSGTIQLGLSSTVLNQLSLASSSLQISQNLADLGSSSVARDNLGLGMADNVQFMSISTASGTSVSSLNASQISFSDSSIFGTGNLSPSLLSSTTLDWLLPPSSGTLALTSDITPITGAASTIVSSDLTANRAVISNGSGKVAISATTSTEVGYLSGVTSAIQTQLNAKIGGSTGSTDKAILVANGTGGATAQASTALVDDGDILLVPRSGPLQRNIRFSTSSGGGIRIYPSDTYGGTSAGIQFYNGSGDFPGQFYLDSGSSGGINLRIGTTTRGLINTNGFFVGSSSYTPLYALNTYSSDTNFEAIGLIWNSNVGEIGTLAGGGGGTVRDCRITRGGSAHLTLSPSLTTANVPLYVQSTVTAAGTTGNRTINTQSGSVNFAAGASSLTVTSSLATANSIILATVRTDDSNMSSVQVESSSGSFIIYANSPPAAETRVDFFIAA